MYNYQIMSNSFGYIDIILLGMIAGFIILRLRSILGRKTGHEPKIYPSFAEKKFNTPTNEVKPVKQNHEILEGKDRKEFLKANLKKIFLVNGISKRKPIKSVKKPGMISNRAAKAMDAPDIIS